MSNSNAASNSNIGYCYSDGMDMIIQVHKMGMIDTAELLATEEAVSKSAERDGNFSQVRDAYVRYTDYVRRVRG